MRKVIFTLISLTFCLLIHLDLSAKACKITSVEELNAAGFNVGIPVLIGHVGDQPLYRAIVAGDGKRGKFKKKKPKPAPCPPPTHGYYFDDDEGFGAEEYGGCAPGVGPCGYGKIEFLGDGRITSSYINIVVNEDDFSMPETPPLVNMYYDPQKREFWVYSRSVRT